MRTQILILAVGAWAVLAACETPTEAPHLAPTGVAPLSDALHVGAPFAEMTVKGEVEVEITPNGGRHEKAEIHVDFSLGDSDGIDPALEGVILQMDAIPPNPCGIVAIPAGAFVPARDGYALVSDDPKQSGVQFLLTDGQGNVVGDLTPHLTSFEARLDEAPNDPGVWRLAIEATSQASAHEPQWLRLGGTVETTLTIGDDVGRRLAAGVELVHVQEPPTGIVGTFADMAVKGEVEAEITPNGGRHEKAEVHVDVSLGDSDGIDPALEGVILQMDAIPPNPCGIVAIPAGAFVPARDGYALVSDDPKQSGVQFLLTDGEGNVVGDLTPNLVSFEARLDEAPNDPGVWRLAIEAASQASAHEPQWLRLGGAVETTLTIGDDVGRRLAAGVELEQGWEPPGG